MSTSEPPCDSILLKDYFYFLSSSASLKKTPKNTTVSLTAVAFQQQPILIWVFLYLLFKHLIAVFTKYFAFRGVDFQIFSCFFFLVWIKTILKPSEEIEQVFSC